MIFRASSAFDRAVSEPRDNVPNLLSAIGAQGLAGLFNRLTIFAWTVALTQVLPTVLLCFIPQHAQVCAIESTCACFSAYQRM
jgi:hypothetical protein